MAKKKSTKKYLKIALVLSVAGVLAYGLYSLYSLGYRQGYLAGTENQVICQASQSNDNLKALCK